MGKPDALSWCPDHGDGNRDNMDLVLLKPELFMIRALKGVAFEGAEQDVLKEIQTQNQEQAWKDSVAIMVKTLKDTKANMVQSMEWKLQNGLIYHQDLLYVPNDPELQWRIVEQHHDSQIAGHAGRWKTLELISWNYWWPRMSKFIGAYYSTCDLCLYTKSQH